RAGIPEIFLGPVVCTSPRVLSRLRSAAVFGVEAYPVQIEVDVSFGLPSFTMVGLPDTTVRESRDRVRLAIRNSGFEFPPHRVTHHPPPRRCPEGWVLLRSTDCARRSGDNRPTCAGGAQGHPCTWRAFARRRDQRDSWRASDRGRGPAPWRHAAVVAAAERRG